VNPITKTNWEGVGVVPENAVKAETALRVAHVAAIEALRAKATDEEHKTLLGRALERAQATPDDPAEDFVRQRVRMQAAGR
jgi:hypothetical protein